jgi:hypothetical protein
LIQALYCFKWEGIGFNQLVRASKSFASRSTIALRIERLVRLGYLERLPVTGSGRIKPIRLTFKCYAFMYVIEMVRGKIEELKNSLGANFSEIEKGGKEKNLDAWYDEMRKRWNALFGIVGWMAMFYGPTPSGDLFLPMVVEGFTQLTSEYLRALRIKPVIYEKISRRLTERLTVSGMDLNKLREEMREYMQKWKTIKD